MRWRVQVKLRRDPQIGSHSRDRGWREERCPLIINRDCWKGPVVCDRLNNRRPWNERQCKRAWRRAPGGYSYTLAANYFGYSGTSIRALSLFSLSVIACVPLPPPPPSSPGCLLLRKSLSLRKKWFRKSSRRPVGNEAAPFAVSPRCCIGAYICSMCVSNLQAARKRGDCQLKLAFNRAVSAGRRQFVPFVRKRSSAKVLGFSYQIIKYSGLLFKVAVTEELDCVDIFNRDISLTNVRALDEK